MSSHEAGQRIPKRVLMISSLYPPRHESGYELVCQSIAASLVQEGVNVRVLTTGADRANGRPPGGSEVMTVFRSLRRISERPHHQLSVNLLNAYEVLSHVKTYQPDWLCVWSLALIGPIPTIPALVMRVPTSFVILDYRVRDLLATRLLRRPAPDPAEPLITFGERLGIRLLHVARGPVAFVFPSEFLRNVYIAVGIKESATGLFSEPCRAIASPGKSLACRSRKDVLFAGRLVEGKGVRMLIEAFACCCRERPNLVGRLILLGPVSREYSGVLRRAADDLGIQERVEFRGVADLPELVAALDMGAVLAVPSMWDDPAPLIVLEAQARGCPVVAYRVGGIPEQIDNGRTGLLVARGDVEGLASGLLRILEDPEYADELAKQALAAVAATNEPRVAARSLLDVNNRLFQRPKPMSVWRGSASRNSALLIRRRIH